MNTKKLKKEIAQFRHEVASFEIVCHYSDEETEALKSLQIFMVGVVYRFQMADSAKEERMKKKLVRGGVLQS